MGINIALVAISVLKRMGLAPTVDLELNTAMMHSLLLLAFPFWHEARLAVLTGTSVDNPDKTAVEDEVIQSYVL